MEGESEKGRSAYNNSCKCCNNNRNALIARLVNTDTVIGRADEGDMDFIKEYERRKHHA